jgi:hypothetical protein
MPHEWRGSLTAFHALSYVFNKVEEPSPRSEVDILGVLEGTWHVPGRPVEDLAGTVFLPTVRAVRVDPPLQHDPIVWDLAPVVGQAREGGSEVRAGGHLHEVDDHVADLTHPELERAVLQRDRQI